MVFKILLFPFLKLMFGWLVLAEKLHFEFFPISSSLTVHSENYPEVY